MSAGIITPVDYKLFGRVGKVEIWESGQKSDRFQLDGLDFQFSTSELFMYQPHTQPATATVKILGLQQASVDYLCQFVDESTFKGRNLSVRVLAGYETNPDGVQELFNMPIVRAIPSAMPDNWVTLSAKMSFTSEKLQSYATTTKEEDGMVTAYAALVDVAYEFQNITWLWRGTAASVAENRKISKVEVTGGHDAAIAAVREKCPFLRITQLPSVSEGKYVYEVYSEEEVTSGAVTSQNVWTVDSSTGMIGVPSWVGNDASARRAKVRTLLNPAYRPLDTVNLTSVIAKDLSRSDYRILTVNHSGHLRGNEWYSDIELMSGNVS